MHVAHIGPGRFAELPGPQGELPAEGFAWIACERGVFETELDALQELLQRWSGSNLVWLHISDLLNEQLPSTFEATPWYDLMVFRRLAAHAVAQPESSGQTGSSRLGGRPNRQAPALVMPDDLDTSPVGFVLFDRVLLTIHPPQCSVMSHYQQRLAALASTADTRGGPRPPPSPAELCPRLGNHLGDTPSLNPH